MFKKHKNKPSLESPNHHENNNVHSSNNIPVSPSSPVTKSLLQFHCQLAHGSPTVFVSGFSNVKELYQKIADSFDFPASEPQKVVLKVKCEIWKISFL
ncbi:hypothetical protein WA026_014263 [Henosepilachna vigintioctopunctata]|uniref:GIPC1-3 GH1 domain-containing protein n=1 Tax=Henosepilachna vigintioctopunctata TaxID=420089 RepID=A0AAW1TNE7_9CUCU